MSLKLSGRPPPPAPGPEVIKRKRSEMSNFFLRWFQKRKQWVTLEERPRSDASLLLAFQSSAAAGHTHTMASAFPHPGTVPTSLLPATTSPNTFPLRKQPPLPSIKAFCEPQTGLMILKGK